MYRYVYIVYIYLYITKWDGRTSGASVSRFRRSRDSDLVALNPGRMKPMTKAVYPHVRPCSCQCARALIH